jgi:hypothetical protein
MQSKTNQKGHEDQSLVAKLCAILKLDASKDNVGQCELEHFDKLKAAELKAFIIACHPTFTKLSDAAHLKNPRGEKSMKEAAIGIANCISAAFGVCSNKSCLLAMAESEKDTNVAAVMSAPITSRIILCSLNSIETKPSDILKDQAKVDLLFSTFNPKGKLISSNFRDAMTNSQMLLDILKTANLLFVMLSSCFLTHLKQKVKTCQQSNRCLHWASKNLALVASWMIVALHVKEDISCLNESKCLLVNPGSNRLLVCLNKELSHRECYLHYIQNEDI